MSISQENNKVYFFLKPLFLFFLGFLMYILIFIPFKFNFFHISNKEVIIPLLTMIILFLCGYHVILEGIMDTFYLSMKKRKFIPNIHILMSLGALGAVFLKEFNDAILLIIIFAGANFLEEYIENRSLKEIKNLLKMNSDKARLLEKNGNFKFVNVKDLKIGDHVLILNGDQIPSDGVIISGNATINESNITGESLPVDKNLGDYVFSSTINLNNSFIMEVKVYSDDTVFSKIIKLIDQSKKNISKTATFLQKMEPIYVKIILFIVIFALCFIQLGGILGFNLDFKKWFYKIIVFLTVASPCALVVSDIPASLSAISHLATKGILFKGGRTLEVFSDVKTIAFDKTGTLTKGKPVVQDFLFLKKMSEPEYKTKLEILLAMEKKSNHPLAFSIVNYLEKNKSFNLFLDLEVKQLLGIGIETFYQNKKYLIVKAEYLENLTDKNKKIKLETEKFLSEGKTVIYFVCDDDILAIITVADTLRDGTNKVIDYFNQKNIKTIMITGDHTKSAMFLARKLNFHKVVGNVLPHEKLEIIKSLQNTYGSTAMVGDGVNDTPALYNSDIGITMKEGTDVAIDIADVILMQNNLENIIYIHKIALKLKKILVQNIIFAVFIIFLLSFYNFFSSEKLPLPIAVTCHEMSTIIVILNSLRMLIKIKK